MSYTIRINTEYLGRDAAKVRSCIDDIRKQMKDMKTAAAELDAMWDGPASEAFKQAFFDDMEALNMMIGNLEKIYRYEKKSEQSFIKYGRKADDVIAGISW